MAQVTSYATLVSAIQDYLGGRTDLDEDLILQMAEQRIYDECRTYQMEEVLSDTISSGVISVPSGFIEFKNVHLNTSPSRPLRVVPLDVLMRDYPTRSSDGAPCVMAIRGNDGGTSTFEFGPYPDDDYTVAGTYYKRLTGLGTGNTSNWLTSDHPDLILYACLQQAAVNTRDVEGAQGFELLYQQAKRRLDRLNHRQSTGKLSKVRVG